MRRFPALALTLGLVPASFGQGLLAGIDGNALHALRLTGEHSFAVGAAVPAELADLRMPRELQWVGSVDHPLFAAGTTEQPSMVTAAWRSDLPLDQAARLAANALEERGWLLVRRMRDQPNVFQVPARMAADVWCRGPEQLTLITDSIDRVSYVVLGARRDDAAAAGCVPQRVMRPSVPDADLPKLELPRDPKTGAPTAVHSADSNSSPGARSFSSIFARGEPPVGVAAHFARQLVQQGWRQDAEWSGATDAGSVWSRAGSSGATVVTTLHVVDRGDGRLLALVSVSPRRE
jgi:hypothetical protein